jgi:hypothetical protein
MPEYIVLEQGASARIERADTGVILYQNPVGCKALAEMLFFAGRIP